MADTALTIAKSRVSISPNPERLQGFTHKFNVRYSDIACGTGSSDTVTLTLGTTPGNWVCTRAMANVVTAFAGTTSFVMIVGTTTGSAAFLASSAVQTVKLITPSTGANTTSTIASSTASSALSMIATFTNATGGSPSALTAGELNIYLNMIDLDRLT